MRGEELQLQVQGGQLAEVEEEEDDEEDEREVGVETSMKCQ